MSFAEFVKDKSIALLASSRHLMGMKQREKLEAFDLIIRINRGFPVAENMIEDISDRTDVLYHLLAVHIASNENDFKQCIGKIQYIISVHHQGEPRVDAFKQINRGRIPFECVPFSMIQQVKLQIRKAPNAGIMAITHLLSMPIKSLYLTGFGFYEHGYYTGYGGRNDAEALKMKGGQVGHDQHSQKMYIKTAIALASIPVSMDAVMQEILAKTIPTSQQLDQLKKIKTGEIVRLKALMTQRHGIDTVKAGDTMLRIKSDAEGLIRKRRAVLA